MYFNDNNYFFHGIMFHHFHDDKIHKRGEGSISKDDFYDLIKFIGQENILDADIFFEKFKNKQLKDNEVCLTFDDGSKSQIDVALPVLEELKIKGFFFPYSSLFDGNPDNLEIFRYFRINYFNNIEEFYKNFYSFLDKDLNDFFFSQKENMENFNFKSPFYSIEDVKFRFVRDLFLQKKDYEEIMFSMMQEKSFVAKDFHTKLFFNDNDLKKIDNLGHLIGLHSHNHPTLIEKLSFDEQKNEYVSCMLKISEILNKSKNDVKYMSHPCGSYNKDTLEILKDLGIELGFKQIMNIEPEKGMKKINNSSLEIAREDHTIIIKRMNQ